MELDLPKVFVIVPTLLSAAIFLLLVFIINYLFESANVSALKSIEYNRLDEFLYYINPNNDSFKHFTIILV